MNKLLPNSFTILKSTLEEIRNRGFVPCTRPNNKDGGIGNTLEDLLSIKENNLQQADFLDYEVKSQRDKTSSPITLFSMATENRGNRRLFDKYKKLNLEDGVERLYWSIYMNKAAILYNRYECQLEFDNDLNPQLLYLRVKDIQTGIKDQAYWDLNKIQRKIANKMKNLVLCYADTNIQNKIKFFRFQKFECYFNFSFSKFLDYLKQGYIQVDFRIGADITGKKAGKYHDHGTGFRIQGRHLFNLYDHIETF